MSTDQGLRQSPKHAEEALINLTEPQLRGLSKAEYSALASGGVSLHPVSSREVSTNGASGTPPSNDIHEHRRLVQNPGNQGFKLSGDSQNGNTERIMNNNNVSALSTSKFANTGPPKSNREAPTVDDAFAMTKLLAKLSQQQTSHNRPFPAARVGYGFPYSSEASGDQPSSNSLPMSPAPEAIPLSARRPPSATQGDLHQSDEELLNLKAQLTHAKHQITRLDQELSHTRVLKNESESHGSGSTSLDSMSSKSLGSGWNSQPDTQSDSSDITSAATINRSLGIWGSNKAAFPGGTFNGPVIGPPSGAWPHDRNHAHFHVGPEPYPGMEGFRGGRLTPDSDVFARPVNGRRGPRGDNRLSPVHHLSINPVAAFSGPVGPYNSSFYDSGPLEHNDISLGPGQISPLNAFNAFQQPPIGSALSPHASEFTSKSGYENIALSHNGSTYLPPTEPLNYRRLLDRNVNCNWKYIVDKIVCNNDQQASIFLQQKLKVGTPEQKYEIVDAIVAQAYSLMVNRFGNFLVQRCFEHGTPEQVIKIAEAIRGNTLSLSMDSFGCHVVQKAFDSVPEEYKAIMVHELLRRIPETVIHRYACHVWQKLFELRWTESPPQIMKFVNEALRGMWHEVALGETGSLVVQNIFENCLEADKRPCIEEVLSNIDIVAHGQFGNWCIQHVCEHGAPPDRSRAIDHVTRYAAEYSTDQFASKVVEKCLKIGGSDFLGRYLDRVCEGRRDRTRIPLIDIASDQYGNYLIQWILNNANSQHREMVAAHIRKHMVSLRGSKFGSRVGMLCTDHAVTTRPGPGVGPSMSGRVVQGTRYGNPYR